MKTIYKISVILITLFVISGCGKFSTDQIDKVDYSIMYENYSNHKLHIMCYSDYYRQSPKECKITKGYCDYLALYCEIEGDTFEEREAVAQKLLIPEKVTVVYDNEYSITFSRDSEMDNLCNMSDYVCKRLNVLHRECRYTFTEADYEYAKTYGEKIEN